MSPASMKLTLVFACSAKVFLPDFNQILIFSTLLHKSPNILFHVIPSGGGRADTCQQTDGRADMKKLTGAFRSMQTHSTKTERVKRLKAVFLNLCETAVR